MRKLFEIGDFFASPLNASYTAGSLSLFGIVVPLSGLGFRILAAGRSLKYGELALRFMRRTPKDLAPPVIPVA